MQRYVPTILVLVIGMSLGYGVAASGGPVQALLRPMKALSHLISSPGDALKEGLKPQPPSSSASAKNAVFWLSSFESSEEIDRRWKTRSVVAKVDKLHASHGLSAARLTYQMATAPAFMMENYLDSGHGDWRGYEALEFDLTNANPSQERMILKLKDQDGRGYSEDIFVNSGASQHIRVRLEDVQGYLDLSHVIQLNLFRWKPRKEATFYLDAVCLTPAAQRIPESDTTGSSGSSVIPVSAAVTPQESWQVKWVSGLTKVFRDPALLEQAATPPLRLALSKGEYESVQILVIGGEQPVQVKVSVGPLTHSDGQTQFPNGVVEIRRVDYVTTKQPYYPVTFVGDWPDPLPSADTIDVPAGQVQPIWITVGAPTHLVAGQYNATITLRGSDGRIEQMELIVTLWDFTLPRTASLKTAFDFYPSRLRKTYQEFVLGGSVWETRLEELQRLYYLDMLKHRVSPILQADPSNARFQQEIAEYLNRGLSALGIGSRGGSNGNNWPKDPGQLEQVMSWYRKAAESLRFQQLLDLAYVYTYDEPQPGDPKVARVMAAIHQVDPALKNLLVMHYAPDPVQHADWLKDADIICLRIASFDPAQAQQLKGMGKEVWMYVSSPAHPFPALVIDYPAIAHRILPWMAWKYGATGLLYWCVDFWNGDPWQDPANFSKDQNGNGALYYPSAEGPVPSIRMEALRDGIEDYEYLTLLNTLLESAKGMEDSDPTLFEQGRKLVGVGSDIVDSLRSYSKDPERLLAYRKAVAETIEKLQRVLAR